MDDRRYQSRTIVAFLVFSAIAATALVARRVFDVPPMWILPGGMSIWKLTGLVCAVIAGAKLFTLATMWRLKVAARPNIDGMMVGRLYSLLAIMAIVLVLGAGFGKLETFGTLFTMFGGMMLGWSLQAPISGVAAWMLVSLKRPFRPGDRVQFPNLGLTGDIKDIGLMYTVLDQVGGTIGSEEAVGRDILVPNAMLFTQVAINYTSVQESDYLLDEVVVRITFDSNWEKAEQILLSAATDLTRDVIAITGMQPYIRSDMYDYGVYMRLRYQTKAKDRAEMGYKLSKRIFEEIQRTPIVDLAIPYVYSARSGAGARDLREKPAPDQDSTSIKEIPIDRIKSSHRAADTDVLDQLAQSIAAQGLLQPIMLIKIPDTEFYEIATGHLRFDACKRLGWKTIPAVVRGAAAAKPADAVLTPNP